LTETIVLRRKTLHLLIAVTKICTKNFISAVSV